MELFVIITFALSIANFILLWLIYKNICDINWYVEKMDYRLKNIKKQKGENNGL